MKTFYKFKKTIHEDGSSTIVMADENEINKNEIMLTLKTGYQMTWSYNYFKLEFEQVSLLDHFELMEIWCKNVDVV